jgi:hypothetical protein
MLCIYKFDCSCSVYTSLTVPALYIQVWLFLLCIYKFDCSCSVYTGLTVPALYIQVWLFLLCIYKFDCSCSVYTTEFDCSCSVYTSLTVPALYIQVWLFLLCIHKFDCSCSVYTSLTVPTLLLLNVSLDQYLCWSSNSPRGTISSARTWWRLFVQYIVRTQLYIYVFITMSGWKPLLVNC